MAFSGRCETEEDPASVEFGGCADRYTKCGGTGGLFTVDGSRRSDQEKELVATRQYKSVPVTAEMVSKAVLKQWDSRDDRESVEH